MHNVKTCEDDICEYIKTGKLPEMYERFNIKVSYHASDPVIVTVREAKEYACVHYEQIRNANEGRAVAKLNNGLTPKKNIVEQIKKTPRFAEMLETVCRKNPEYLICKGAAAGNAALLVHLCEQIQKRREAQYFVKIQNSWEAAVRKKFEEWYTKEKLWNILKENFARICDDADKVLSMHFSGDELYVERVVPNSNRY